MNQTSQLWLIHSTESESWDSNTWDSMFAWPCGWAANQYRIQNKSSKFSKSEEKKAKANLDRTTQNSATRRPMILRTRWDIMVRYIMIRPFHLMFRNNDDTIAIMQLGMIITNDSITTTTRISTTSSSSLKLIKKSS